MVNGSGGVGKSTAEDSDILREGPQSTLETTHINNS